MRHQTSITQLPLLIFLLLSLLPLLSQAIVALPAVHGYFTEEFYPFSGGLVNKQNLADQWTVSGMLISGSPTIGDCNGWFMLGGLNTVGPGGFFQKVYTDIPTHNVVYYVLYLIVIDDWVSSDRIYIQFDSGTQMPYAPLAAKTALGKVLCGTMTGTNNNDVHYRIVGKYPHSGSSLSLKIISGVNGQTAGFGINYVQLSFHSEPSTPTQQQCATWDGGIGVYGTDCSCPQGQYRDPTPPNTCQPCDTSCYHCFGAGNTGCYVCKNGYYYDGNSCLPASICPTGCYICSPNNLRCSVCSSTYALSWDYTCVNPLTCTSPYILDLAGTYQFCRTPCQATNTFMFWNGNCTTTCNFPLQTRIEGKAKFCDYKCTSSQYLHINGTCATGCDYFLRTEDGHKFCDPCLPLGYYKNWLGTCMAACPAPMISVSEGQYLRCLNPCSNAGEYYYPRFGACRPGCEYPFNIVYAGMCVLDLTEDEENTMAGVTEDVSGLGYFMSAASILLSGVNFANPGASIVFALSEIMEYIRYMKIKYPPKLQYLFEHESPFGDLFLFLPDLPEEKFERYTLPQTFEYYQVHSKFLVNIWTDFLSLLISFGTLILVLIMIGMFKKGSTCYSILDSTKKSLKWNYFISTFATFYGNIVIATSLELRTLHLNSFLSALSFIICLFMNVLAILIFVKTITVTKRVFDSKVPVPPTATNRTPTESHLPPKMKALLKDYEVIFENYRLESMLRLSFMPIFIAKQYLFCFAIGYLFDYPMIQATFLVVLSLLMVAFLMAKNPFKEHVELLELLLQEVLNTVICVCVLILAIFDQGKIENFDTRATVGEVIIVCNFICIGVAIVYMVFHLIVMGRDTYQLIKSYCADLEKKRATAAAIRARSVRPLPARIEPNNLHTLSQISLSPNMMSPPIAEVHDLFRPKPIFDSSIARELTNGVSPTLNLTRPVSENINDTVRPLETRVDLSTHHYLVNESALGDSFTQSYYGLVNERRRLPGARYSSQKDLMFINDQSSIDSSTVRTLRQDESRTNITADGSSQGPSNRKKRKL